MKKILSFIVLLTTLTIVLAQTVSYTATFIWTPNPANELVSGYRIEFQKYVGSNPGTNAWQFSQFVSSTTNTAVIKGLQVGYTYRFRAFALNSIALGTNLSNIIQIPTNSPSAVTNFNLSPP